MNRVPATRLVTKSACETPIHLYKQCANAPAPSREKESAAFVVLDAKVSACVLRIPFQYAHTCMVPDTPEDTKGAADLDSSLRNVSKVVLPHVEHDTGSFRHNIVFGEV